MELLQFTCLLLLISLKCLTGFGQQCGGNQWQCDDGACLPLSWHCDGNGDCMDGSDEMACPCPRGQVACMAGAPGCVNTSAVCDGLRQCSDGSDEFNCPENQGCLQGDWRCRNKICIPKDLYCNGANDCVDNSDEACGRCGPMAVRCPGGACLTEDERCDGKLQCSDGSDEPSTCGRTCSEENGGCSHSCVDQPWGALCSCPKGYRLSANGASCLDVDECALPYGPCMHFCVNTPGSFYCHCRDGFQLQGTTYCYAKGNYTKFLTAKKGTIGFLNLKTLRFESIQSIGYDPLALAFDLSRSSFYWADDQGNIYKAKEQQRRILYHGQYGVRSLVCDWLTGQLYWTNQKTRSIHVGAADGSGFATVLAKNIDPLELVLLPIESLLFWINKGPGDKITLERSGMDGIKQESLVVLTAQAPRSLTLDVTARRLYWMSDFKKSIETVRVDGNGRYSFLEFFKRRPAQSLAVFERWFYWTDQMGLWRSPQDRPNQKTFIQRTTLPVLEAYHEQQQPKAPSACVKSGCQLCMLTLDLPAGFTCTCPDDKLLMADGSCEYPRFAYATSTTLNLFELKGKELIKTKLLTTDDVMESFDIDWRGDWVYWANSTGHVMRWNLNTSQTETVPTLRPACVVAVDQKMRNLYWLSCDEACVGVTNMDQGYPRRLYQSGSEVRDVYLDWQRGRLYLLEAGWILSMRLPGGNPRKVLRVEGHVAGRIVLDLQSNTLLWNTEGDDLKIMSLLKSQTHLVGREWNIPGSIVAAHSPLLVSLFNDVITVWDRRDKRRVHDVPVGPGVVRVIVALDVKEVPPAQPVCTSPSVMCRGSTLCISQTQLCDTFRDCPDGFDEESCITKCPNRGEFRCKDRRKCIKRSLVCDGRAHCHDGSDEIGCPTIAAPTSQTAALKCRMGSRLCKDGRECVLHSHVCDGEVDCKDGSDEQDCGESPVPLTTAYLAPTTTVPDILPAQPVCTSPSVMCRGSTLCISQTQLCDTLRDCPDGFDEESCITKCPNRGEFRCKDRRKCIKRSLVCDGRAHCHDGSDEIGCPTIAAPTSQTAALKCRMGSRLCKDGRECVLHSHVCDGEVDCKDGSDEQDCGESPVPLTTAYLAPTTTVPDILPAQPVCTSPSVMCRGSTLCISQTQLCDTLRDCPDGFDEESCITKCPNRGEFRCKDRRKCIKRSLVCDGRAHCHDGSDEIGCPTIAAPTSQTAALKCRMGSRLCKDGRECVLHSHVCDGEVDCKDGSDEQDCGESPVPLTTAYLAPTTTVPDILPAQPVCTSPSVMCRGSTLCISQTQLCDTLRDCPDGFDEESCITKCPNRGEFRCKDRRKCIKRSLVCDGRAHCHDGSDEIGCPTIAAPTSQTAALKCRMGSRLCKDGRECVLHSHVCDGEVDCKDGSDEQDCELLCKAGQFQCAHGKKCIDQQQMCDGKAQCQDRSDEMDCFKPTKSCSHRCDNNSRCIPETFLCDGERDCSDGSDEEDCVAKLCGQQQYHCSNGQCVSEALRCDGHADCGDHSDEVGCAKPPHCPPERRCPNSHECLVEEWLCDGEQDCQDGSDEMNCKVSPVTCGEFQWSCVSKTQCIPATWRCDGQKDCEDYSDEAGCDQLKCSNQLYQCGSGECVDHSLLCDHIINCPDGSDEGHGCSTNNCSSPGTPQCDQHCVSTPYGPRCICAAGFRLQANGLSCVDVDECNEVLPPVCSHICLNTRSSFLCRCHHGYLLEPNGHSCKTQDEAHLLASVQNELLVLGLHSSSLSLLSTSQTPVFCVDYDWRDQRVYWVSLEEESIKWTSINTKETGTLVKGVKSDSIAVDWVGRNLYWLDGLASQILAVRLGTSTVKSQNYIVVLDEDLEQPRSLLLLPHKGLMYWSEVGSDPQIERSGMDGSERKVVLTRGLSRPVSLSVDTLTDRIYWADEKLQCIGSVSLEGHNVRLLQLTEMPSPFSVMVFNDMVYWSDTKRRTIQVSHKNTGKNRKVLLKRPGQPFGIRIMHPLRQSNVSSPCEKLQCSHICLLAPGLSTGPRTGSTGPKAVCRCAAGLLLAGDGLTCSTLVDTTFLLLLSPTAVTQIYLSTIHNGVGLKRLPEHHIWSLPWAHQASGLDLAVQERNLYLADAAQGSVDLLKLSSSGLTPDIRVLNLQDDTVMAMAVDWVTLNLYWSSRKQPDLHVTTTRGQHTAPLLQLGLQGTTSIALHPPSGRLCFTALGQVNVRSLPQVACAFMDGRSQKLLWRKAVMPTSLLFSSKGTRLYWADIGAGVIDSILLDGSGYKQFKADPGLMSFTLAENVLLWSSLDKDVTRIWFSDGFQPKQLWFEVNTNVVALRVYSKTSQKGTNSCSERNGGCSQLCLAYPGGRSCRCGRGYQPVDTKTCSPFPPLQCPEGSRACSDGSRCLPLTKFCNHQTDCLDHSDEIKCWSGVKPQDVSHSKPSPGHAGNTVPPSQDWSGRTTPGGVDVQKLDSESCDAQQCNGHGKCVARGGETTCQCVLGYHGVFCEEGEGPGVSNAPLTLGILSLIGGVLIAAVIIRKSRARAAARGQSTDKETLMTNMDEQTVYAVSFNNDLYDPDQELISSADGTSQHL
ncbi:low-density lipoprotein receptor-related protein 2-like isoform X35 [Oncorhynchus keta]|uniref:low-density lipoprotein receptor-related protein 2-like isoform X33 n=1 Tax=Oncorhynchus keta TaxID=8018 RepID=UPI00227C4501|nr:low-density lipoprotein receptor-related protein 2-like isoform X33 [Oncorhynchus keta]XP_052380835.1 low-density lipoprotein receptor-related protein 2-like isoform X34 [Oncorhynchus keta]XP_052380836.1 low-density lipoprotein receptor-related protein 2-like isoform X35 [Oncorhynchus keta]